MPAVDPVESLAEALRPLLPETDLVTRATLARTLVDLAAGTLQPGHARRTLRADPKLQAAYAALAGKQLSANGVPISFAGAQTGDVTVGTVAGGDVVTIGDVTITLPPDDAPRPPRWWQRLQVHPLILALTVLLPLLGLISVVADFGGFRTQVGAWVAPFQIESEQPGESLILVAPFERSDGVMDTRPHREIASSIRAQASALEQGTIRVVEAPEPIPADDPEAARRLGDRYDASIIVWGSDTGARVRVFFFNRKEPDLEAAQVQIDETLRSQLASPSAYVEFVTRDLPGQITFLTLFGLGQAAYTAEQYEEAGAFLGAALSQLDAVQVPPEGISQAFFQLAWIQQVSLQDLPASLEAYSQAIARNPTAEAYSNRGAVYRDMGELELALADHNRAIELSPAFAAAYNNRGIVYSDMGELALALADYSRAIELDQAYAAAYSNRGIVYSDMGELELALAEQSKAIELDPAFAAAYSNRGIVYRDQGELALALADQNRAIELNPAFAAAYSNRGIVYRDQGELELALADQNKAIELNPAYAEAYSNRGTIYADQGELALALADQNRAIELNPAFAAAYSNRGIVYREQGELALALADQSKAIELNPAYAEAYSNRGIVYREQGELALALADQNRAIELNPAFAAAYSNRGVVYREQGELALALADQSKAIELNPAYAEAYSNRGIVYSDMGELALALADQSKAIELNPAYAAAYNNRGVAYYKQGELGLALVDYSKAIELDPAYAAAYGNRGIVHTNQGEMEQAIADYGKAIELDPGYLNAYYNRGVTYKAQGQRDLAIGDFRRIIELNSASALAQQAQARLAELDAAP